YHEVEHHGGKPSTAAEQQTDEQYREVLDRQGHRSQGHQRDGALLSTYGNEQSPSRNKGYLPHRLKHPLLRRAQSPDFRLCHKTTSLVADLNGRDGWPRPVPRVRRVSFADVCASELTKLWPRTLPLTYSYRGSGTTRSSAQPIRITESCQLLAFWLPADLKVSGGGLKPRFPGRMSKTFVPAPVGRASSQQLGTGSSFSSFAHHLDSLDHELQAVAAPLGAVDRGFDVFPGIGVVELFAEVFDVGMDFGVDEEHLATEAGGQEQLFIQDSGVHKGRHHAPVSADLSQPVVFLCAHGPGNL